MHAFRCLWVGTILFAHCRHSTVVQGTPIDSDVWSTTTLPAEWLDESSTESLFEEDAPHTAGSEPPFVENAPIGTSTESASEEATSTMMWNSEDALNPYDLYCKPELCLRYNRLGELVAKQHVACGFNGSFGDACPVGRMILKTDPELRKMILHLHNEVRDRLAGGFEKAAEFAPASRMPTVVWDDELANLAEINVRSCRFEHDECRSTEKFPHAGQNLAVGSYYLETDVVEIVRNLTTLWYNEYADTTQQILDQYTTEHNATIGHYTQMISDRTTAVGCGIVIYPQKMEDFVFKMVLYACNYAITSIVGQPVYLRGEPGSRCATGNNPHYASLCSIEENALIKAIPAYV